jgi:hypothetical protein
MNTPSTRQAKGYDRYRSYRKTIQEARAHYRSEWLAVRKANPKAGRKKLIDIASFLYLWLRKNDSDWIEVHLPPVIKPKRQIKLINWKQEDRKLAVAVKNAAKEIRNLAGRPVRVSITAVTRETGHRAWIERRLNDLPLTARAIKDHIETLTAYSIRKVRWAENQFYQEKICPSRHRLMARATVRNKTGETEPVQSAINEALKRLRRSLMDTPSRMIKSGRHAESLT